MTQDSRSDDEKDATDVQNESFKFIKMFEDQLLSAVFDKSDEADEDGPTPHPIPELLEEERTRLRDELHQRLRHLFLNSKASDAQLSVRTFEEVLYSRMAERIRRQLGFYQALSRAQEEVRLNNQELGDPTAITLSMNEIQKTLAGLDEVDFVRQLGTSLGLNQHDLDRIVDHIITTEFGATRKMPVTHRPSSEAVGRSAVSYVEDLGD